MRVSLIKHAHHGFDVDRPGKDSCRHREAGCGEVLVTSSRRWALMHELRGAPEPRLEELIGHLSPCELVLVEGFKRETTLPIYGLNDIEAIADCVMQNALRLQLSAPGRQCRQKLRRAI